MGPQEHYLDSETHPCKCLVPVALLVFLFVIFPPFCFFSDNSCCLSPILLLHPCLLCRSRERNGENNALFQEEAALNFQILVTIGVVNLQIQLASGLSIYKSQLALGLSISRSQLALGLAAKWDFTQSKSFIQVLMVTRAAGETKAGKTTSHLQTQ